MLECVAVDQWGVLSVLAVDQWGDGLLGTGTEQCSTRVTSTRAGEWLALGMNRAESSPAVVAVDHT